MPRVIVDVMLKPEILDPQGKAVAAALPRLGFEGFADVRQGKRFELTVEGEVTEELLARVEQAAETLLSNPVIEDVVGIFVESDGCDCGCEGDEASAATCCGEGSAAESSAATCCGGGSDLDSSAATSCCGGSPADSSAATSCCGGSPVDSSAATCCGRGADDAEGSRR